MARRKRHEERPSKMPTTAPLLDRGTAADADGVTAAISSSPQALDTRIRDYMEPRLLHDFGHVRVHTDGLAARSAEALGAAAYTIGDDVVFGAGQYSPHTERGRELLAHELTHVAQPKGSDTHPVSSPASASEREADRVAGVVSRGGVAEPTARADATIQREPLDGTNALPPLSGGGALLDNASPMLAAAAGSTSLEGFDTGKAELKPVHRNQLQAVARNITALMRQYPLSTLTVFGHADTVDSDEKNQAIALARATTTKQALVELGIDPAIVAIDVLGERAPQPQPTRDNVASARNRSVQVRFHPRRMIGRIPAPKLQFPEAGRTIPEFVQPGKPRKPPIDIFRVPWQPDPDPPPPQYFKPVPPQSKGSQSSSGGDFISRIIDPVVDAVAGRLPRSAREAIKEFARDQVIAGIAAGVGAFAEAQGLHDKNAVEAIEKAVEKAVEQKGWTSP